MQWYFPPNKKPQKKKYNYCKGRDFVWKIVIAIMVVVDLCVLCFVGSNPNKDVKTTKQQLTAAVSQNQLRSTTTSIATHTFVPTITAVPTYTPSPTFTHIPTPTTEPTQTPTAKPIKNIPSPTIQVEYVYVTKSGSKYHNNPSCSNMKSPSKVPKTEAETRGYDSCKKCY